MAAMVLDVGMTIGAGAVRWTQQIRGGALMICMASGAAFHFRGYLVGVMRTGSLALVAFRATHLPCVSMVRTLAKSAEQELRAGGVRIERNEVPMTLRTAGIERGMGSGEWTGRKLLV